MKPTLQCQWRKVIGWLEQGQNRFYILMFFMSFSAFLQNQRGSNNGGIYTVHLVKKNIYGKGKNVQWWQNEKNIQVNLKIKYLIFEVMYQFYWDFDNFSKFLNFSVISWMLKLLLILLSLCLNLKLHFLSPRIRKVYAYWLTLSSFDWYKHSWEYNPITRKLIKTTS